MRRAFRSLWKNPGYALLAVGVIALGVGANAAVFTVVHGTLFAPLPYRSPGDLVRVATQFPTMGFDKFWISAPEYLEYREWTETLQEAGAFNAGMSSVQGSGLPFRAQEAQATASLLRTLGLTPALGRLFTDEDDRPGAEPVVVLADGLWRRAFGADPEIIGERLVVDGAPRTVIGVLPPGVDLLDQRIELWSPLALDPTDLPGRGSHNYIMIGRLAPGAGVEAARGEISALMTRWQSEAGDTHSPHPDFHPVILLDLHEEVAGAHRPRLMALLALAGLLLFAGCANLANLILGRTEARRREIAFRTALGSGRRGLVRPFLAEGFLLAAAGGVVGVILAVVGVEALLAIYPSGIPRAAEIGVSWQVLAFAAGAAGLTGLVCGVAPALHVATGRSESRLLRSLQAGGERTTPRRRLARNGLVVIEVALSAVLLIACLLLVRSLFAIRATDPGFAPDGLTTFQTFLPPTDYPDARSQLAFMNRLLETAGSVPGVESVTYMSGLPPRRRLNANDTALEGVPSGEGHPAHNIDYWQFSGPGYFETMGVPLLSGRGFEPGDDGAATPVAVVNRTAAELFWPDQDPVGRRLRPPAPDVPWFTIVGVARDVKQAGLDEETGTEVYFHYPQTADAVGFAPRTVNVVVRSALPPERLAAPLRAAVHGIDPALPVESLRTLDRVISDSLAGPRFLTLLLVVFAALSVLLASAGTYGVLASTVTERTPEMGVRMAMGAGRRDILRLVLGHGMRLAAVGLAAGTVAAFVAARFLESVLFGVTPADVPAYAGTVALILAAALLACMLPARRAARIQPVQALRHG